MKKCPKCSAELPDEAVFCNNCGANLNEEVSETTDATEEVKEEVIEEPINNETLEDAKVQAKNTTVGLIAVVAAAAVALIILICILASALGGGYKKPIKTIVANLNRQNTNVTSYLECFAPKFVVTAYDDFYSIIKSTSKDAVEDLDDEIADLFDEMFDDLEDTYGDDYRITIEYKKVEKLDKDDLEDIEDAYSDISDMLADADIDDDDFFEDLSDELDDEYGDEISDKNIDKLVKIGERLVDGFDDVNITAGYSVKLKVTIKGEDDKDSETIEFNVIKVNGKWIIDVTSYADMLYWYL